MNNNPIVHLNQSFLNELSQKAKICDRLRINYDLRNSTTDLSQRMLNAVEPGTLIPIHRHRFTSETIIIIRGSIYEIFYNDNGEVIEKILMKAGETYPLLQIPAGQWHNIEVLEPNSIIFEAKDGKYTPLSNEDILNYK